ncbi:MAG: type II toxin-antitoxin system YafQ family toxin [Pseudomonadota bacterium]
MFDVVETSQFRRDIRRIKKRGKDLKKLKSIVITLSNNEVLPLKNRDHELVGNWRGHRECHIEPDWLLVYRVNLDKNILELVRMGTHSDLF